MFPFHFFWNIITSDHFKHISGVLYNIIATISIFILYVSMSVFFLLCRFPIKR
jgi:pilus assembly protein TadC